MSMTVIRHCLSSLDHKIADVQDNIAELNSFVKAQQDALTARGEQTEDLLFNLFTAYMTCSDSEFLAWTQSKEDEYNEGNHSFPEGVDDVGRQQVQYSLVESS
jgi:hypothetical protein